MARTKDVHDQAEILLIRLEVLSLIHMRLLYSITLSPSTTMWEMALLVEPLLANRSEIIYRGSRTVCLQCCRKPDFTGRWRASIATRSVRVVVVNYLWMKR